MNDWEDEVEEDNANDLKYSDFFEVQGKQERRVRPSWKDSMDIQNDDEEEYMEEGVEEDVEMDLIENEKVQQESRDISKDLFSNEEVATQEQSTFEIQQSLMMAKISQLESENLGEKKWTLRGEVSSKARPLNSLLQEDIETEQVGKPVPVIDEESTSALDEIIIQRIKDHAFDDVVRKLASAEAEVGKQRRAELDGEKSNLSLSQLYESEYAKQTQSASTPAALTEREKKINEQHVEIDALLHTLFTSLDTLANFYYTPPTASLELVVAPQQNVPAILMEDVIPSMVSDGTLLAPKEVYDTTVGKSQEELDQRDKRVLRLKAKRAAAKKRTVETQKKERLDAAKGGKETSQAGAVKQLMRHANVTIISKDGKGAPSKSKGQKSDKANIISREGRVHPEKIKHRSEMLRL